MNSKLVIQAVSLLGLSLMCAPQVRAVKLLGIYNNMTSIGKIKAPRVDIVNDPIDITSSQNIPPTVAGTIHPIELPLPAYINITYGPTINNGEPFTIKIEDTGKPADCPGHKTQVKVGIKDVPASLKTVCVSQAISQLVGTRQDRWQNVLLAIGNNPKYASGAAKGSEEEFPFIFGLSGWSSSKEPWHRDKISATSDKTVKFDKALRVIQGHLAFGGDSVPRFGHASIAHIYNDSPYILLLERSHLDKRLATTNFREIVPPLSAVPFAMMFVPKIEAAQKGAAQKSALYIHAMGAPEVGLRTPPPPTSFEYIFKAGTSEIGAAPVSAAEIGDFVANLSKTNPDQTAEILGEETLDKLISNNYAQYFISKYYYKIYGVEEEKKIYVERCKLGTDECTVITGYPAPAVSAYGDPNYFKLIVKKDTNPFEKANFGITLDISPIPQELEEKK